MDVFSAALESPLLRDAAIAAAHELGVFGARPASPTRRMRALLRVIDALAALGDVRGERPVVPREGWGLLAEVIRSDRPLAIDPVHEHAYQRYLVTASAPAARELVERLPAWLGRTPRSLIDLGGGAGAYTAAFLDAFPEATATLVDIPAVAELAREHLARFGDRVRIIAGDARTMVGDHDVALLANVLHLHGPETCGELCAAAARSGELVVVKDLDPATVEGMFFALGMAIYTDAGDVYSAREIGAWLVDPLVHVLEATPEGLVVTGRRARPEFAAAPPAFRRVLERAGDVPGLVEHYSRTMPQRRREQMPRLRVPVPTAAIDRLDAVLAAAGVATIEPAATIAEQYERSYYGELMPMLYGDRDDLVAPLIHELCHLGRNRTPLDPPHLDECVTGWLSVHAYPATLVDLYGAPWLAQVGQAVARTFGIRATIRAHAGLEPLPAWFTRAAEDLGWRDWQQRRSLHLLADTMDPVPWVELARSRGVPDDPAFDRQIVHDALVSMCLHNTLDGGTVRARQVVPDAPVVIDGGWMTTAPRGVDRVPPRYWVPLAGHHELRIGSLADIPRLAAELSPPR